MSNGQELVLHKKSFQQLTTDELYELLRVRSEVFVVEQRSSSARFALRRTAYMLDGIQHIKMTWRK